MTGRRILLVEDDPGVVSVVEAVVDDGETTLEVVGSRAAGVARAGDDGVDLFLVDLGLPDGSGFEVLRAVRAAGDAPVILLTGAEAEVDRVLGFELGTDDYVTKPFYPRELQGRIRSVLRRSSGPRSEAGDGAVTVGDLVLHRHRAEVEVDGRRAVLAPMELRLLEHLMANPDVLIGRDELLRAVWRSSPHHHDPSTVTVHVRRLRAKIEDDPDEPRRLVTVRGHGYRLVP